jgi:hypothetical protein
MAPTMTSLTKRAAVGAMRRLVDVDDLVRQSNIFDEVI